ncbi:hypothetical protein AB0I39_27455 [Kitasatospora purpeofusca]|uniref:hypothetical protein n=1 Tax=Kitasatospora purpeofusca TaxID=67352 RepID=UPI0033EBACD7
MSAFTARRRSAALALATAIVPVSLAFGASSAHASVGSNITGIALANNYKTACATNSAGTTGFYSSCTGNGGQPERWCADFAKWVWAKASVRETRPRSWTSYGPTACPPTDCRTSAHSPDPDGWTSCSTS